MGNNFETVLNSESNSYQCMDYSPDCGSKFVCGGKLPYLEVYDDATLKPIVDLKDADNHSNKILCCKFHSADSNTIFSGGWDGSVLMWDIRAGRRMGVIAGPMICGDAIDTDPRTFKLLTGSHTKTNSIQIWDLRTLGHVSTIPWSMYKSAASGQTMTYAAKFIKPKKCAILACGVNAHAAKIFSANTGMQLHGFTDIDLTLEKQSLVVVDSSNNGKLALIGTASGNVIV